MKVQAHYLIMLFALIGTSSCEKTITVKLPEEKNKLVINSYATIGETIGISVSKSDPILKFRYNKDLAVKNAIVILLESGKIVDTLQYDDNTRIYTSHTIAQTGKSYEIKVTAAGFEEASAESMAPSFVNINTLTRNFNVRLDESGNQQDEIKIEFDDSGTTGDYYIIRINMANDSFGAYYCINTSDASVENIYDESIDQNTCLSSKGIFIRDNLFNGNKKTLRLYTLHQDLIVDSTFGMPPRIELLHVTQEYFKYEKSYQYGSENFGNPFAEPVNVYTNIKNGYGVFSILSSDLKEIN